jgi:uncharacterized protein (DUF433 family)
MDMDKVLPITHVRKSNFGTPKVGGITVAFLSCFIDDPEWPVERITSEYRLTPAQIHAAWSYYYDHQDEIEDSIRASTKLMEEIGTPIE